MKPTLPQSLKRLAGRAWAALANEGAAASQRVIRAWRDDASRTYPTIGLTPSRALAIMQAADRGEPQQLFELFDEMLQRWPRLAAVEQTRRLALTGLDWEIKAARGADNAAAASAADFCHSQLASLGGFAEALDHLASAIGHGVAVAEVVWEQGRIVDLTPVPHRRLLADRDEPWRLRVRTAEASFDGVLLDEHPNKFMVHRVRRTAGRPMSGGLLRASLLLYLAQNLSFKDWLAYSQIAGMPVRVARYEPGLPDSDKQELVRMLEALGAHAVAAFSKNIDLNFLEGRSANSTPYGPLQEYCNTEVTILWLGQHLTTDIRNSGSRAAAEIHDRVREDLLVDDIAEEAATVRRDLLTPLVRMRFGDATPVPEFRRSLVQSIDTRVLAETLAIAVRDLDLQVPRAWLHNALGVPEPNGSEATVASATEEPA